MLATLLLQPAWTAGRSSPGWTARRDRGDLSDCAAFGRGIGRPDLSGDFQQIQDAFENPEEIDDSPETAPSKRVERLVRGYEKPLLGTLAALEIGLVAIRRECPHFGSWLDRLEQLPSAAN